jgi:diguanylate cyclase (GGDEF)-like protein
MEIRKILDRDDDKSHTLRRPSRDGPSCDEPSDPAYTCPPNGMAASDPNPPSRPLPPGQIVCLLAQALKERLNEEISRAARHHTPLSCLLVVIDNLEELSHEHGSELPEQVFAHLAKALGSELRPFDRIGRPSDSELLLLLPGADGPRGEIVARRMLDRLRTIKIEVDGTRRPLRVSVGLATWRKDVSGEELLTQTRAATWREQAEDIAPELATTTPLETGSPPALGRPGPS